MLPVIPVVTNKLIQDKQGKLSTYPFPPNIAGQLSKDLRQRIFRWMLTNYIWPQIQERKPFEEKWDKLLQMARATWKLSNMKLSEKERLYRRAQEQALEGNQSPADRADLADTVIFDAVDRLTNLNHFISFKNEMPVQFQLPPYVRRPMENTWYSPSADLVDAANGWGSFCANNSQFYRKHWMQARHHYTYGISFCISEYEQEISSVPRRVGESQQWANRLELTKIGVTFEGISIRKIWLNTRLSPYHMDYQPCPFWFEEVPRFAIVAKPYDQLTQPFGYENLDSLPQGQWLFGSPEMDSLTKALQEFNPQTSLTNLGNPELNVELNWVFMPMLPLAFRPLEQEDLDKAKSDEERMKLVQAQGVWDFDETGEKGYPMQRYIMEAFGNSLVSGNVEITRLQQNFYPHNMLPLYGSAHMPDMDSGLYSPAFGDILESHYTQICKALNQYLDNKDVLNDPPAKVMVNSPAMNHDLTKRNAKIPVNSLNDYEHTPVVDATGTTPAFVQAAREQAQTSSKSTDAIVGKAMGSRTSATEAQNIFQTAMSGVTTDVNLFNYDISGGYYERCWYYAGHFVDPDVLQSITGQYGFIVKPEHFLIRLDISWQIGSMFIESMTRQQNYRYMLETGKGDPAINSAYLWEQLLNEWKIPNAKKIINDGGMMEQIMLANDQAAQTYLGDLVMVDPDQNHDIAIKVKMSYLKDRNSVWNSKPEYAVNAQNLVRQISQHSQFLFLQQQMMQQNMASAMDPNLQQSQNPAPPPALQMSGQAAQMQGGTLM